MKKSVSKKMFALSVLMSAGMLLAGCSGTAAEPSESTPEGSSTEAMQGSVGVAESGTNHISEKVSDMLVIDADVILPKEQVYSVYALTKQAFPREHLEVFFGVSQAAVTDHPEWVGAYSAETEEGGYFSTDPYGTTTSYIWWNPHIIMPAVILSRRKKYRIYPFWTQKKPFRWGKKKLRS